MAINSWITPTFPDNGYYDIRAALVAACDASNPVDMLGHMNDLPATSLKAFDNSGELTLSENHRRTNKQGWLRNRCAVTSADATIRWRRCMYPRVALQTPIRSEVQWAFVQLTSKEPPSFGIH